MKLSKKKQNNTNNTPNSKQEIVETAVHSIPSAQSKKKKKRKKNGFFATGFVSVDEKISVLENISMQVVAGMDIIRAVSAIEEGVGSKQLRRILVELKDDLNAGSPLWQAFERTGLFSEHIMSLIRLGEQSGRLSENLEIIVMQMHKDRVFKSRIRSALMYPVFVLALTVIVGTVISVVVLPQLVKVFEQMDVELPTITVIVLQIGTFLEAYGALVIPGVIIAMILWMYFFFFNKRTRFIGQKMLLMAPGIKTVLVHSEIGRFGYLLGTLIEAGIPIVQALESMAGATSLHEYEKLYRYLAKKVYDGELFRESFSEYKGIKRLVPPAIQQLMIAGEQSGRLSTTLISIGKTFEHKTEQATKNLTIILEPVLLLIIWSGVVLIALSVVLPVYRLIGGFEVS